MKKRSNKDAGFFSKYEYHIVIGVMVAVCVYAILSKLLSEKIDVKIT